MQATTLNTKDQAGLLMIRKSITGCPVNTKVITDPKFQQIVNGLESLSIDERYDAFEVAIEGDDMLRKAVFILNPDDDPPVVSPTQIILTSADLLLADYEPTDAGNTEACASMLKDKFVYCSAFGWLWWTGKYWNPDLAEAKLRDAVTTIFRLRRMAAVQKGNEAVVNATKTNNVKINPTIGNLKSSLVAKHSEFDSYPNLLCVQNGTLDLKTGVQMKHDPAHKLTHCLDVEYDPNADIDPVMGHSIIENFLVNTIKVKGGLETAQWMQRWYGYCATGEKFSEIVAYWWGAPRAGKGTVVEAIQHLLGPLVATTGFSTWAEKREDNDPQGFALARLRIARLVVVDEFPDNKRLDKDKIKRVSGNGNLTASHKGRDQFEYLPQFKIQFISNFELKMDVDDDAAWGRWVAVEFPNGNLGSEDLSVKELLKTDEYQRALLAWIVKGAGQVYADRHATLHAPPALLAAVKARREELDGVGRWFEECCLKDTVGTPEKDKSCTTNEIVRESYEQWCRKNGETPKTQMPFAQSMRRLKYSPSERFRDDTGRQHRGYRGFKVNMVNLNEAK